MDISLGALFSVLVSAGLLGIAFLWYRFELAEQASRKAPGGLKSFHCVRCANVYGSEAEPAACPQCAFENAKLHF